MLPSNMLLLNRILLIDVTFSTPTGLITSLRFYFAFSASMRAMGIFTNDGSVVREIDDQCRHPNRN
jgi:hypothetical protein